MTTAIKRRRGTTTQHSTFTGLEGEITVDTTKDTLVVHDGATAGGFALLREDLSNNTNVITTTNTKTLTNKTFGDNPTFSAGTANGVAYLNGSKVLTTGSALTFDGTNLVVGGSAIEKFTTNGNIASTAAQAYIYSNGGSGSSVNSGFLLSGSDNTLRFYTGNSEQMRLTSTGLGIGTSSPAARLDVTGVYNGLQSRFGFTAGRGLEISTAVASGTNEAGSVLNAKGTGSGTLIFQTDSSERMRLDSSGNLGLGVTPSASIYRCLQLPGGAMLAGISGGYTELGQNWYNDGSSKYIANGYATLLEQQGGQFRWLQAPSGTAGNAISFTQAMTLDASGNLLVGGTSSVFSASGRGVVEINGSTNAIMSLNIGGASKGYLYANNSSSTIDVFANVGWGMTFSTAGTERMRIDSSGNLMVGGTTANSKLTIGNSDATATISPGGINTNFTIRAMGADGALIFGAGGVANGNPGTERMRIDSSGNLLLGTTVNPVNGVAGIRMSVSDGIVSGVSTTSLTDHIRFFNNNGLVGSIQTNGSATSYNTSSDYRLKENIQPMQNALATVAQLNPVTYTWKADGSDGQGFIAHELQAVVPDCVTGEKDAVDAEGKPVYQGIDTSFLVATLTKAIQEQQEQINQLKAEVAILKGN